MERKMDTNSNFSNSNTQIDAGIPPAMDCRKEIIGQLPNPAVKPHLNIENCCCFQFINKRRLHRDSLADKGSFANEQQ